MARPEAYKLSAFEIGSQSMDVSGSGPHGWQFEVSGLDAQFGLSCARAINKIFGGQKGWLWIRHMVFSVGHFGR